jgi:hypothetical protein
MSFRDVWPDIPRVLLSETRGVKCLSHLYGVVMVLRLSHCVLIILQSSGLLRLVGFEVDTDVSEERSNSTLCLDVFLSP